MQTLPRNAALRTGLAYAGLAVTGLLSYLVFRPQLYVPGDATATAANLTGHEWLARGGVAVDLAAVLAQALAALLFFALFRAVSSVAAGAIAAFGLVNATVMLVGTAFSATALSLALPGPATAPAATSLLMYDLDDAVWQAGALFFGLWLIPMGWCTLRSAAMPRLLGWILVAGGIGYVLSAFVEVLGAGAAAVGYALTVPATVGELWMVGYLLLAGLRRRPADPAAAPARAQAAAP